MKVGETLDLGTSSGTNVNGGNAVLGNLEYVRSWMPLNVNGGQLYIDPNVGSTINDALTYGSYIDPLLDDLDMYLTEDTTINWSNTPDAPVAIMTAPGVNLTIESTTVPEGVIFGQGNVTFRNGTVNADIYCDGDLNVTSGSVHSDLYCRGDFIGSNAQIHGNLICDGYADWSSGFITGYIYSQDGIDMQNA